MKTMIRIVLAVALAAALGGCDTLKRFVSSTPNITIGQPQIALAPGGYVVVDQSPLLLIGRSTVTWRLPADGAKYEKFSVTIDQLKKRVQTDGKTVRYVRVDPKTLNLPLKCGPIEGSTVQCDLPAALEKNSVYSYTIRFVRDGLPFELDPDMML